jgi:hypothetical protein
MADITKKVDRSVAPTMRSQTFTNSDADEGDVILVEDSLGHKASHVSIEATDTMVVRFNVYRKIFAKRTNVDGLWDGNSLNLTRGGRIKSDLDATEATVEIASGSSFELDEDLPVADIELVTVSGVFEIFVS